AVPGAPSPTLINPGGTAVPTSAGSGRNAIVSMGGAGSAGAMPGYGAAPAGVGYSGATPTPSGYNPSYPGVSAAGAGGLPAGDGTGLRQIPSRAIRTDVPSPTAAARPMTRDEAELLLELNRKQSEAMSQSGRG